LETHPTAADFHYERARLLEREEADLAERIAAFEQAAALDPTHAGALLALGRHAGERGEVDEALLLFDRSAAADLSTATPAREAAQLLAAVGRNEEAEERLDALLREFAYDAAAALTRATLGLASDGPSDRHYELARRAVRFGGGPAAAELLSNIESQRANLPQGAAAIAR
jgi:tetratricopeptide (TPR) repeat protein